jgi:hypothetical protein
MVSLIIKKVAAAIILYDKRLPACMKARHPDIIPTNISEYLSCSGYIYTQLKREGLPGTLIKELQYGDSWLSFMMPGKLEDPSSRRLPCNRVNGEWFLLTHGRDEALVFADYRWGPLSEPKIRRLFDTCEYGTDVMVGLTQARKLENIENLIFGKMTYFSTAQHNMK